MTSSSLLKFDYNELTTAIMELPSIAVDWAISAAQSVPSAQSWQTLINAMALSGLEQWLEEQGLEVSSVDKRQQVTAPIPLCQVNGFRLYLLTQGSLSADMVRVSSSAMDQSVGDSHLYVLAQVNEEVGQVTIVSGLRRDHIAHHRQQSPWTLNPDDTYSIPLHCFDTSSENLLLYLNCLAPEQLTQYRSINPAPVQQTTANHATNSIPAQPTQTWQQVANNFITEASTEVIKISGWLTQTFDDMVDQFTWDELLLQPTVTSDHFFPGAVGFRGGAVELDSLLSDISSILPDDLNIPNNFISFQSDSKVKSSPVRLYAVAWPLIKNPPDENWSLLVFVVSIDSSHPLPPGTSLTIADEGGPFSSDILNPNSSNNYLYTQVIGNWDESFVVSATLPNQSPIRWPAFTCPFKLSE